MTRKVRRALQVRCAQRVSEAKVRHVFLDVGNEGSYRGIRVVAITIPKRSGPTVTKRSPRVNLEPGPGLERRIGSQRETGSGEPGPDRARDSRGAIVW